MGNLLTARGIVLKETFTGEADKYITIFAKDYGKLSVFVKNSKRVRSGLSAGTVLFSYSDFYINEVRQKFYLNNVEPIETFYNLRNNLSALAYGSYIIETVNKVLFENMPANNILLLLLKALTALSANIIPQKLISSIFELKLLEFNGYMPEISRCKICGKPTVPSFYITSDGAACEKCVNKNDFHMYLDETMLYTLNYIFSAELNKLFTFKISSGSLYKLSILSRYMMDIYFNLNLKSYKFIKEIEEL